MGAPLANDESSSDPEYTGASEPPHGRIAVNRSSTMRRLSALGDVQVKIAVLLGGDSMERDVSIATAGQVVTALRSRGHEVVAYDSAAGKLSSADEQRLFTGKIDRTPPDRRAIEGLSTVVSTPELRDVDVVFLALHGGHGEDGTVQALLDLAGIPYTGTGMRGSALGWDKDIAKRLFRAAGVPTPDWRMAPVAPDVVANELGFPLIVKPNGQGSTVGLTLVEKAADLDAALAVAADFDGEIMLERYVPGRELTVPILDGQPLAVGEIIPATGPIFDYAAKYQAGGAEEIFPAKLPDEITRSAQALALAAHQALKLESYSRVDFRMDAENELWCLEVNTLPGLSAASLVPRGAAAVGITFPELCERICTSALAIRGKK
jgi:D-alanine-D-alanine ligase